MSFQEMDYDKWLDKYKPVKNHFNDNASFDGCLFETYGSELEHVTAINQQEPGRVWTLIDADGESYVESGFHYVNRMGYIITEVAVPDGVMVSVKDD